MANRAKVMKTTRSEREVLAAVLDAARVLGLDLERQNTGAFANPRGQMVRCGKPGNSDLAGQIDRGPNIGKVLHVEVKAEGFEPTKLRGDKKAHFDRQLARLRKTNEQGGVGFYCDDAVIFMNVMRIVLRGGWVEIEDDGQLIVYDPEIKE
jgi:hypothetical protein